MALRVHRVRALSTDVEHPIGESHADRASLGSGDGPACAGQLQRVHDQRHRGDAQVQAS